MSLNLDDLTYKIRLDDSEVERAAASTAQSMGKLAGAATAGQRQFTELGKSTKLSRQEMLTLQYTMNDVAASLASGTSPFTILLQQGGQVTQAFGGLGGTLKRLGGVFTVGNVAMAGTVAVLGGVAAAFVAGTQESIAFERSLQRTGNGAGITAGLFNTMAADIAKASGASIGASRDVLQALVSTGQIGPVALQAVGTAAASMARAFDISEKDAVKSLAGMTSGVAKWAAEYNKSTNFITVAQYEHIRKLEEQHRLQEAMAYTAGLVHAANERVTKNLGTLATAWQNVGNFASAAWDAMLNIGRQATLDEQIEQVRRRLEMAQRASQDAASIGPYGGPRKSGRERIEQLQEELRLLNRSAGAQRDNAVADAAAAAETRRRIKEEEAARGGGKPAEIGYAIRDPQADAKQRFLQSEIAGRAETDRFMAEQAGRDVAETQRQAEEYRRRTEQAAQYYARLGDQAEAISANLITDERARGEALLAIERAQIAARIDALQLLPADRKVMEDQAAEYMLQRERQLTEELKPEWQRRAELYADSQRYMAKFADDFRTGFVDNGRQAFEQWVATGKISTQNLVSFIQQQFARLVYDKFLSGIFDQLASSFLGSLSGIFGGGAGGLPLLLGDAGGYARAAGGPVSPYRTYLVGEQGPELLRMGAQGGAVVANDRLGGSVALTYAPQIHIDSRTDQAAVAQQTARAVAAGNRQMLELLKTRGVL